MPDFVELFVEAPASSAWGLLVVVMIFPGPSWWAFLFACCLAVLFDAVVWEHGVNEGSDRG
jgi:hypothetical protein